MSILVNFLKMPNNCDDCIVSCDCPVDASYDGYKMEGGRPRYCPLIELPPHGRLIDIKSVKNGKFTIVEDAYQAWWNGALEAVIENAPTVIEAEGENI